MARAPAGAGRAGHAGGEALDRLRRLPREPDEGVRRRVADQAREVFLQVPTHVVHEPGHFGGELHVALDVHRGFFTRQHAPSKLGGRGLGEADSELGRVLHGVDTLQQAGARGRHAEVEVAPLHTQRFAGLAAQPLGGGGLLLEHVVKEKHQLVLQLVDHPAGRSQELQDRSQRIVGRAGGATGLGARSGIGWYMGHDHPILTDKPAAAGTAKRLLQGLNAGHQPATRAAAGTRDVPDLAEGVGTCRGLLADQAGELHAGHVLAIQFLDAQQLRLQHHHLGVVGAAALALALRQLALDLLEHVVGHHGAQAGNVRLVPGRLQVHEVGLGGLEEAIDVKAGRDAPGLAAQQGRADHGAALTMVERSGRAALPGSRGGVVADVLGAVAGRRGGLQVERGACRGAAGGALPGQVTAAVGRLGRRLAAHHHAHDGQHHHRQQGEQQELCEGFAEAQGRGQPGQAQASRQAPEHGAPGTFGRGGRRGCGGRARRRAVLGGRGCRLLRGRLIGRGRRVAALRHVARLLADGKASTQALGHHVGGADGQRTGQQEGPEFVLVHAICLQLQRLRSE